MTSARDRKGSESTGRRNLIAAAAALSVLALSVLWVAQRYEEEPLEIEIRPGDVIPVGDRASTVRLAVAPLWSSERTASDFRTLTIHLASKIRRPVRLVQRKTCQEVNELLGAGAVQLALVCTGAYLHSRTEGLSIEVFAVPIRARGPYSSASIVVRSDSGLASLEDLAGRSIAFTDPMSLRGHYYPLARVLDRGEDPSRFFSSTTFTGSHDRSLEAVLDGAVDAASVDSLAFEHETRSNPVFRDSLRVIDESPRFGVGPVVVPASIDARLRDRLQDAFLEMASSRTGRRALAALGVARFARPPRGLWENDLALFSKVTSHLEATR